MHEPKVLLFVMRIAAVIVIIVSTRVVLFSKMTSYSPILNQDLEQGRLMAALNSRK